MQAAVHQKSTIKANRLLLLLLPYQHPPPTVLAAAALIIAIGIELVALLSITV